VDVGDRLRELATDAERRRALGERSREFVLRHHSLDAVGSVWDAVFRHVWSGAELPARASDVLDRSAGRAVPQPAHARR
jgi:hypothetical protein